jgi:hypothetical protein
MCTKGVGNGNGGKEIRERRKREKKADPLITFLLLLETVKIKRI